MLAMSCSSDLIDFIARHRRIFVLTGAGCSTNSGIPDYRDREGNWKRTPPVTFQDFVGKAEIRQRYWARSQIGWPRFSRARPNPAHLALARLEERGQSELILTQNVDRLHQNAVSQAVIDLHGRLDQVRCLGCDGRVPRESFQLELERRNGRIILDEAATAPDGDADLVSQDLSDFSVPDCPSCGGMMKPDVVFFGENVPAERVRLAMSHV